MKQTKKYYMHKIDNLLNILKIVTIHYQKLPKGYASAEEAHDFWEIIYADKSDIDILLGEEKITLKQGEIFFVSPNAPHYVESGDRQPYIFIVSFECRSESMQLFCDRKIAVPKNKMYLLQNIMTEALGTFELPDFDPDLSGLVLKETPLLGGEQIIKNSLEALLIYLLRQESERARETFFVSKIAASDGLEDAIVRILREKIYSRFSLAELSEELHYGITKLCMFFKEKTGTSIYQTYLRLKTDEAKSLILKGVSFGEIAELLCFDSIASFHNTFKKMTGMTPKEYRNSIKK